MPLAVRPRRLAPALVAVVVAAAGLLAPHPAAAATAATRTTTTTLAPGVTLRHQTYTRSDRAQSVFWVTTTMSAHTGVIAATPGRVMGAKPMSTLALARQEKAVAGLSGDTFYFDTSPKGKDYEPTLGPRGGVVRDGLTLKAPLDDQNAVFTVDSAGRARIGPVGFAARVTTDTGSARRIVSVNSIETAWNGNIAFLDTFRASHALRGTCAEAVLKTTGTPGSYLVTALYRNVRTYHRVLPAWRALLTCSGPYDNLGWLTRTLHPGTTRVTVQTGYRTPNIRTLISGVTTLVRGGRVFHDDAAHRALNEYGSKAMPETFVCVRRGNRAVVSFGTFEGHRRGAVGVTYAEEAQWLATTGGCWEAMALDGSTSAQLVAQRPGSTLTLQNRATASYPGGQRPQVDGLFVVRG